MPITGFVSHCLALAVPNDSDTTAWVAAVVTNGGTVSSGRQAIVNNFIIGLKADSLFTKFDRLWLFAAENTPSALTDVVSRNLATVIAAPTFTTDRGYTGNGSTQAIDSGVLANTGGMSFTQNSASFVGWSNTASNQGPTPMGGSLNNDCCIFPQNGGNCLWSCNGTSNISTANSDGSGLYTITRNTSTSQDLYRNASHLANDTTASNVPDAFNFKWLGMQGFFWAGQCCAGGFGGVLTGTDVTNFYNRMRTYMTQIGVP